jgi:hypothetical protein
VSKFDTANFFSDSPVRLSAGIAAGAVPAAVALIAVQLFLFWKRFPFVHSTGHSSQSTGYYKQIKHLFVLVVCQLLDRFTTASRVRAAALFARYLHNIECLPTL